MKVRLSVYDPEWLSMGEDKRECCRAWLRSCGGEPNDTQAVRVEGEGCVIAETVRHDDYGGVLIRYGDEPPYWPRPLLCDVRLWAQTPPPWWEAGFLVHV